MTTDKSGTRSFEVLDVQSVTAENPSAAVKTFALRHKPNVRHFDVVIAGGGMGGVAAAIRAVDAGLKVALTEETDWLGGQMTAQAVSALDENAHIETSGGTALYRKWRSSIRAHYRKSTADPAHPPSSDRLNPGNNWVTRLSFEPQVAVDEMNGLLAESVRKGKLTVYLRTKIIDASRQRGHVNSVLAVNLDHDDKFTEFHCRFLIDATEIGDMLPLLNIPYVSGAESREDTGEPHAPVAANPENVQDFTYSFIVELEKTPQSAIPRPIHYERFNKESKFTLLGYKMFVDAQKPEPDGTTRTVPPFWTYRRLIARENYPGNQWPNDVALINWEAHDMRGENIIDQPPRVMAQRLALGKALSLGFLHWLQTAVARDEGGIGYPELKLRPDWTDTADGLSKYPYIRESRRIKALYTVKEMDIAESSNTGARARLFDDSVGIGLYPIDIHGHQDVPGAGQGAKPFQIPLASMVQRSVRNFLPGCKNIGTTHVTNGAYRLHPIEWAIGEAAGVMAAYCIKNRATPERVLNNRRKLRTVQRTLIENGCPLFWFSDVSTDHQNFAAIQFLAAIGAWKIDTTTLLFEPEKKVSPGEVMYVLSKLLRKPMTTFKMPVEAAEDVNVQIIEKLLKTNRLHGLPMPFAATREALGSGSLTRGQFAQIAYGWATTHANFGRC